MIDASFSARDRRTLVVGVAVVVSLVAVARGLPAFRQWDGERREAAMTMAGRLGYSRQAAKLLPALRDTLRARRERFAALDSLLVWGNSPAAAAANLASIVGDLADDSDLKINAIQIRADSVAKSPLSRVAIRLTGVADVAGLSAFLRAVDGNARPLAVRELAVSQPEPAAPDNKPELLRVDVLVETIGLIKPGRQE